MCLVKGPNVELCRRKVPKTAPIQENGTAPCMRGCRRMARRWHLHPNESMARWSKDGLLKRCHMKHKGVARRSRNQSPHPALRATFSQREKDTPAECPSPSGRECREAAGEGSKNFVEKTRSNILVTQRGIAAPTSERRSSRGVTDGLMKSE